MGLGSVSVLLLFICDLLFFVFYFLDLFLLPPQRGSRLIARPPGGPKLVPPNIVGFSGGQGGRHLSVLIEPVLRDRILGFGAPPHFVECQNAESDFQP
jgi:hypothetical protein